MKKKTSNTTGLIHPRTLLYIKIVKAKMKTKKLKL